MTTPCDIPGCIGHIDEDGRHSTIDTTRWRPSPLSVAVTTRDDVTMVFDGRATSPKPDLSSLDDVDKAAIRVLLQQVLRQLDPPRATGGPITVTSPQPWVLT